MPMPCRRGRAATIMPMMRRERDVAYAKDYGAMRADDVSSFAPRRVRFARHATRCRQALMAATAPPRMAPLERHQS